MTRQQRLRKLCGDVADARRAGIAPEYVAALKALGAYVEANERFITIESDNGIEIRRKAGLPLLEVAP